MVPCGDGKITVSELVEKAIIRYRKVTNKVSFFKEYICALVKTKRRGVATDRVC